MKNRLKIIYYILYCIIFMQLYAACETLDDFNHEPITFVLTGKTKKASLASGILEITRRISLGDEAAIKCKAMLSGNTMELQEATLNAYNAELRTLQARLLQGKQVAIDRGLDGNFKGTPSKAIAAAEIKKLQADMLEKEKLAAALGLSPMKTSDNFSAKVLAKQQAYQAELKRIEDEKLAQAEELRIANAEVALLKSQPVGLGGGSARPIDQLVATISLAKNITIKEMIFDDAAFTVSVHINLNGEDVTYQVDGMDSEEYDRLKIFLALSARMHSKTFNAASSAVGDLLTDILSSSAPQAYHLKQTAQLAATTSRLDEFLNYHIALQQKLTGLAALPLSNFLAIRFLSSDAVEVTRSQVLSEFKTIHDQIPLQDELPLGSQALDKFLKKIASSIELPTEIEFSTKEIEDIFGELGLLLETDSDGIVIDSDYYNQLLEFSKKVTALKKRMISQNAELCKKREVKEMISAMEESILSAAPAIPINFLEICNSFNDPMNIGIAANGLQKSVIVLQALTEDDRSLNMPLQDDGLATTALKREGTETASIQAVLFLLQKFAKTQFDNVIKNSIVGNLDPAIQAACTKYYGRAQQDIRKALLNAAGFAFNERNYKKLKGSENVTFIKLYLESITTGNPIVVNLDELKERTLGIQSSIEAKRKTVLILRVSDLLYSSEFQPKLSVEEATAISERSADFDNPAIADAVLQYELQDNTLKTERDKKRFLDAYLRVRLAKPSSTSSSSSDPSEVSHEEKVGRLKDFFAQTLASTAKDVDLVKLVLTLPMLKKGYQASFDKFKEVVNEFNSVYASDPSSSSASDTRISALRKAFTDIDSVCTEDERPTLKRTLDKLLQLQEISQKFLTVGNSTGAMVSAGDSLLQDSSFPVTAGISQLEFDTVLKNTDYNVFYNAVKILNLIALAMPSADDFSLIEELMLAKIPSEESEKKEQLKQLLIDVIKMANEMRQQSTEFYGQITTLMQFVDNFEQQKNKYNESSGEECINFHERLDALSGTKPKPAVLAIAVAAASVPKLPVGGGVVDAQPKVERCYTEAEIETLGPSKAAYKKQLALGLSPDAIRAKIKSIMQLEIEPKYTGGSVVTVAASAPKLPVGGGFLAGIVGKGKKRGEAPLADDTADDDTPTDNGMPKQHRVEAQQKVERVYTDDETRSLTPLNGYNPMVSAKYKKFRDQNMNPAEILEALKHEFKDELPDINIPAKYEGDSDASAPAGGLLAGIVGRGSALNLGGSKPVGVASLLAPKPPVAGGFLAGIGKGQKRDLEAPLANDGITDDDTTDDDTPADNGMPKQHRVEAQQKVERVYTDDETRSLISLNGNNAMVSFKYKKFRDQNMNPAQILEALKAEFPDINIPAKYEGDIDASAPAGGLLAGIVGKGSALNLGGSKPVVGVASLLAPKQPVGGLSALFGAKPPVGGGGMLAALGANQPKFIYATLSPMGSLVAWLNKTEQKLKEEMTAALGEARSSDTSNTSVLINKFYKPLMEQQIAYLQQVDFSKLEREEDSFYLVRQVLTTADLYLRIQKHEKMLSEPTTAALKKELQSFENKYFSQKDYTISEIIKAFKTPAALNAHKTNQLLVRIKTGGSDLKRLIGNTIIEAFEAGSTNIIDPVITAIESY